MYYCPDCGYEFLSPAMCTETHRLNSPPYEKNCFCPNCKQQNYYEKTTTHCRCCGSRLPQGVEDYCSYDCRIRGEKLWRREQIRRKLNFEDPLGKIVHEVQQYNLKNNTDLSYGQYVSFIRPGLSKDGKL